MAFDNSSDFSQLEYELCSNQMLWPLTELSNKYWSCTFFFSSDDVHGQYSDLLGNFEVIDLSATTFLLGDYVDFRKQSMETKLVWTKDFFIDLFILIELKFNRQLPMYLECENS